MKEKTVIDTIQNDYGEYFFRSLFYIFITLSFFIPLFGIRSNFEYEMNYLIIGVVALLVASTFKFFAGVLNALSDINNKF